MVWTMTLPVMIAAQACPVPPQKIPVTITALPAAAIGAAPDARDGAVQRVGPFVYQGKGIVIRSSDPRFADLVLDQRRDLRHRCGNPVFAPSPWNVPRTGSMPGDMAVLTIPTAASDAAHSGATEAERHGVRPVLAGHVAGPSWPVHHARGSFFVGLMYPTGDAGTTRLVAFRDAPGAMPAVTLAVIPMRLQTAKVVPGLHEANDYLHMAALRPAEMAWITLRVDPAAEATIAAVLDEAG